MTLKPTDSFETPDWLFNRLHTEFDFTLDAAASATNAKVGNYFTVAENGLQQSWANETVWCNPPYSGRNLRAWARKAHHQHSYCGATVVMLVPVSISSVWWRKYAVKAETFFFHRRIRFSDTEHGGLRDSVLLVFQQSRWYPPDMTDDAKASRSAWDQKWRDLFYPGADLAGRWWSENCQAVTPHQPLRTGAKLRMKTENPESLVLPD